MRDESEQLRILYSVMRAEGLYSLSERKRALAILLKLQQVSGRIIADLIGVSAASIQGWWRDWQVDPDFKALIDRRRAYSIRGEDRQHVIDYLAKEPPAGLSQWSVKALAKVLKIKMQDVETILKVLCQVLPERIAGDEHVRAGIYERFSPLAEPRAKPPAPDPIDPERQQVFSDTLAFIDKLESGVAPSEDRQLVFKDVLHFVEGREQARQRGLPLKDQGTDATLKKASRTEQQKQKSQKSVAQTPVNQSVKPEVKQKRERHLAEVLDFIQERDRLRGEDRGPSEHAVESPDATAGATDVADATDVTGTDE